MFVINANASQESIAQADYISAGLGQYISLASYVIQGNAIASFYDYANKYIYILYIQASNQGPLMKRYTYGPNGLSNATDITLSGFGTFTGTPQFWGFQGSKSSDFKVYFITNGNSGSITAGNVYNITISGTTATLGGSNTVPVIASYSIAKIFAKNSNIYVFYYNTSGNLCDTGRKWNGTSWGSLSGAALPSSLGTVKNTNNLGQAYSGRVCGGTLNDIFYCNFYYDASNQTGAKFNTNTDTWQTEINIAGYMSVDINGFVLTQYGFLNNGTFINGIALYNYYGMISNILEGVLFDTIANSYFRMAAFLIGNNRNIRRIAGSSGTDKGLLFSQDGGVTFKILPYSTTLISSNYNLNYFGNIIVFAIGASYTTEIT